MAIGTTATMLMVAGAGFSAASSIAGANQQAKAIQKQAEYNAQVYGQQAEMIKEKKKIQDTQFLRNAAQVRGTIISRTAGKGFLLSGSPAAVLADTETQMLFDKAIEDYNLDVERNFALSAATNTREQGRVNSRLARYSGYSTAFSTILNTGANIGMLNMPRAGKL